jgi:hypothetical protein
MCNRRNPTDPLVREFLQTYSINLLPLPRLRARPGELYIKTGRKVKATPGWLDEVIEPAVELPEPYDEPLPDLSGVVSETVDLDFGLKLLGNFLAVLGIPPGIIDNVKLGYKHKQTERVAFQFSEVSRQTVDPVTIGSALIGHQFRSPHPWIRPGNQYFVAAAFVRSPSITVHATDAANGAIEVGAGVASALDADVGVTAEHAGEGKVRYRGKDRLAIGAELYELSYDADAKSFLMGAQKQPVALMRGKAVAPAPAFPGDDDEALLEVEDL